MRVLSNHVSSAARYQPISSNYDLFDRFGRTVIRHWRPSYVAPYYDHFVYTYDRASNRVTAENERTTGRDWLYTYDGLHRLSDARMGTLSGGDIVTPDFRHNWSLDMLGNWSQFNEDRDGGGWELQQTRTHNAVNELTGFTAGAWKTPQHDPRGNMTTMPRPGDEDATTGKSIGAVYDIWNRQVRTFDDVDGDGVQDAGEEIIAEYRYDGQNRRIRKFLPRYTGTGEERTLADWTVRDDYYNQNWQLLETRKADDVSRSSLGGGKFAEPAAATAVYCQYIWSPHYIDAPVLRDRNADGDPSTTLLGLDTGLEERTLYSYDANYNVTALWQEGANGFKPVERYSYDPYGKVTVLHGAQGYDPEVDGSTIFEWMPKSANPDGSPCVSRYDNEILYCGYRFDWETGLYNVRHRIYHPTLGRWTTRDPLGYVDGAQLYEYCKSDAISLRDSLGLEAFDKQADDEEFAKKRAEWEGERATKSDWNGIKLDAISNIALQEIYDRHAGNRSKVRQLENGFNEQCRKAKDGYSYKTNSINFWIVAGNYTNPSGSNAPNKRTAEISVTLQKDGKKYNASKTSTRTYTHAHSHYKYRIVWQCCKGEDVFWMRSRELYHIVSVGHTPLSSEEVSKVATDPTVETLKKALGEGADVVAVEIGQDRAPVGMNAEDFQTFKENHVTDRRTEWLGHQKQPIGGR